MPPALKIVLADDHLMFRQALRGLLERENFNVLGEAGDGHEAVRLAHDLHPDVVVVDFAMPLLNGLEAARAIGHLSPVTRTVLLTIHTEHTYVFEALRAGVGGYVVKTQAAQELVQAIREVSRGQVYLSPRVSRALVDSYLANTDVPADPLTSRERQVLQLVAEGKRTKEIAHLLGMSVKTAETHRARLMEKLDIHDTAGLVRYAIRHGAIEL
jgi:two-component system response regulator NreC